MRKQDKKVGEIVMKRVITIIATFGLAIAGLVYTPSAGYASTVSVGVAQSGGGFAADDAASKALPSVDCGVGSPVPLHTFANNTVTSNPKPNFLTASEAERANVAATWPTQFAYRNNMGKVYASSSGTCTDLTPVYRFYNKNTHSHFYTTSTAERDNITASFSAVFTYEGARFVAWKNSATGRVPVYRYFNSGTSVHLFASDVTTAPAGFVKEGVAAFYVQGPTNLTVAITSANAQQLAQMILTHPNVRWTSGSLSAYPDMQHIADYGTAWGINTYPNRQGQQPIDVKFLRLVVSILNTGKYQVWLGSFVSNHTDSWWHNGRGIDINQVTRISNGVTTEFQAGDSGAVKTLIKEFAVAVNTAAAGLDIQLELGQSQCGWGWWAWETAPNSEFSNVKRAWSDSCNHLHVTVRP